MTSVFNIGYQIVDLIYRHVSQLLLNEERDFSSAIVFVLSSMI